MDLRIRFKAEAGADGAYQLRAQGHRSASLFWANEQGPLSGWMALAHVPLDADGMGCFDVRGCRAIPPEATHVAMMAAKTDNREQEVCLVPLPSERRTAPMLATATFAVMSDLHLSRKPGRIRRAVRMAAEADAILIPGDLTNDGMPDQLTMLADIIDEEAPHCPVLGVTGNHDYPLHPLPMVSEGISGIGDLQAWLLDRATDMGVPCAEAPCGAYRAAVRGVEVLGLNAVSHGRRFVFHHGEQLRWLEEQLAMPGDGPRIVLCHAPLLRHNPVRLPGKEAPYLSRDAALQETVDRRGPLIFLSGHTHLSPNDALGCAEWDASTGNIYFNDGSVAPTMLRMAEALDDREWVDGVVTFLRVGAGEAELSARSVHTGRRLARGYHRFPLNKRTLSE